MAGIVNPVVFCYECFVVVVVVSFFFFFRKYFILFNAELFPDSRGGIGDYTKS